MLARNSLVVLAFLSAGCLKDLSQVESSSGGTTTDSTSDTASTASSTTDKPATCGDGKLDPGEQCDDGNSTPDDGCENDCTTTAGELCGNGTVDDGEDCDDGNSTPGDGCENNCTETVISPTCGDGEINGTDECDDGNTDNTDACTNTCKLAKCGDSIVQAGVEGCDDGNTDDTDDCVSCVPAKCGDGFIHAEVETCDNGDNNSDDAYEGCTTQCQPGPRCGDMVVQGAEGEECDDGTPDGDDLCNACTQVPFRYVFVTSGTHKGDVNKLSGADARCSVAASELPAANWIAWLSDDLQSPASRMDTAFIGWYILPGPEQIRVARDWAGLTSGTLLNPINRDEAGNIVAADASVWTNTKIDGKIISVDVPAHCNNWDSNVGTGNLGNPNATDATWTNARATSDCGSMHHLYCVQN